MFTQSFRARTLLAALAATFAGVAGHAQRAVISKHLPEIVKSGQAKFVSAMDRGQMLHLAISLPLRNEDELDALITALYDPTGAQFHHYLSAGEFDARFGPTEQDFRTLVSWAEAKGMKVTAKASNRRLIEVDASVAAVNEAFHITETGYRDTVLARSFHAPDREPTTDLSIKLLQISGLDDATPKFSHLDTSKVVTLGGSKEVVAINSHVDTSRVMVLGDGSGTSAGNDLGRATAAVTPSDAFPGTGSLSGYYLPGDMRKAYYGGTTLTGAGQIIGIFSFDGYLTSDITAFYTKTNTSTTVPVQNVLVNGYSGACTTVTYPVSTTCEDTEQTTDIVQAQGMAPGLTKILFYEGTTAAGILNHMVTDNQAKVITSSWSGGDFGPASDTYFKQMAAQGQTYLNATGDNGGFNSSTYTAPGLSPYVLEVGGTDLTTNATTEAWVSETGWSGSGGGFYAAAGIAIPSWQQTSGVITATNGGSTTYRNSPDVGADANLDSVFCSDGCATLKGGLGGTSLATPRYAGYLALANQQAVANGLGTIGFINPSLYGYGLGASKATIYHDTTSGSNASAGGTPIATYTATAGYDLVTGWGSPNTTGLLSALSSAAIGDFTLSPASSTIWVQRGAGSISDLISIAPNPTFNGTVALSYSGNPTGITAGLSSTSVSSTGSSTLTLSADNTVGMNTYPITVTGTSGSLSHSTVVNLLVGKRANDDFTITASAATVAVSGPGSSTITVTPGSGLAGGVALSLSNIPTGITATLTATSTPNTVTTSTSVTLNVNVAPGVAPGTYALTVTGTTFGNLIRSVPVTINVLPVLQNGGFETGAAAPWTIPTGDLCTASCGLPPHTGSYYLYLNGYGSAVTEVASQQVSIPTGTSAQLGFYLAIYTNETSTTAANDTITVQLTNTAGTVLTTLGTFSNLDAKAAYILHTYNLSAYLGQTVVLKFTGVENSSLATAFLLDDAYLNVN